MFEGVWPLVTYCPPVWIMRTAEHQARPETIFFSLCSTKKKKTQKQENTVWHPVRVLLQANRCSHSSLCLWSSYSKPVYVFALTLFYLWQLFAHAFVCVPVRVWDPHTRDAIWKGASVCSAGDEVCAVCCSYLSLRVYWRRQQRPRRCLWGGTSFSFLSKCPPPIVKAPAAQPGSAFKQKKKKTKASSSWTILPGSMTPLLSHSVKSEQLETRGVSVIREAPYEVICRESTFETSPMNECDADCVRGTS